MPPIFLQLSSPTLQGPAPQSSPFLAEMAADKLIQASSFVLSSQSEVIGPWRQAAAEGLGISTQLEEVAGG